MCIPAGDKGDPIYSTWRDTVNNQMLARGYLTDLHHFADIEFQQIVTGVRPLRPVCDELATALTANDIPRIQEVDETILQLIKDCGKRLTNTIKRPNKPFSPVPGVPPAQVAVLDMLLPANPPPRSQWGLATAVQNAGAGPPNTPPANTPRPAQIRPPAPAAGPYQNPPPPLNPQASIQLPLPVSGNPGPSGSGGQNVPPPAAMPPLKFRFRSSGRILKILGAAPANNLQQVIDQVVVNNAPLNNPPQTAGGGMQIQAPPPKSQGPNQAPSTVSANAGRSGNQIQAPPANTPGLIQRP